MPPERLRAVQVERYQAHLELPHLGLAGQQRLLRARVLIVGVGGLGCPAAQYLVAAGVGTVGLVDDDIVDRTNLQRQVLFGDADCGRPKVEVAAERLAGLNRECCLVPVNRRLVASNASEMVADWDLVLDGSDNFGTRYVVNDACVLQRLPLASGSLYQWEGQVTLIDVPATPCYRCTFPASPPEEPACKEAGVLGPLAGLVGSIMAVQAVVLLAGEAPPLAGQLLLIDARSMSFRQVRLRRDPACRLCGDAPTIERPTALDSGVAARS